ncbi:PREDICTED: probable polygalacturonase At3g15720 isoform X2 [Tarenaya hassleriana]|uniref:probable polygalacturonase At3g15720 isoform X2 n=1 Tax=Tarenaya hassleriana TaxID=28532 RepID=UPI00053C93AA|nr:PREDICTED: probable polygalacturonase At3g15720 isoform X2 [Tarenaya hassleriana]
MECSIHGLFQAKTLYIILILSALVLRDPTSSSQALDVTRFGALGDGITDDSQAFLRSWETVCKGTGHGTDTELIVPADKIFMLQPLKFLGPCKSGPINFQVYGDIVAPRRNQKKWKGDNDNWIVFSDIDDLIVEGDGLIDGQGSSWWKYENDPRPTALKFKKCKNLQLRGLRHIDSPMAHIHINNCYGVTISDLRITAPESSPNTDGIDIAGSTNVQIQNCFIGTGDDCIAINSGSSLVNISGVQCGPGHGISIGSLGKDGEKASVEEVYVQNCSFTGTTNGARIKTWQTSAVKVSNVLYDGFVGTSSTEIGVTFSCSETVPCTDIYMSNIDIDSEERGEIAVRGACLNAKGFSSTPTLPGLDCLTLARNPPQPSPGRDFTPPGHLTPWVFEGKGKRNRVPETVLALFLCWVIYFRYIL